MNSDSKKNEKTKPGRRGRPPLATRSERLAERSRVRLAAERVSVSEFLTYRDYLQRIYEVLKASSPSYSYGQLSEDLGLSRSNVVWLIITGRRSLTPKACERIIQALGLAGTERRFLEALRAYNNARRTDEREEYFHALMELKGKAVDSASSKHALEYYSEWYHPIIREMVGLADFRSELDWINGRLVIKLLPMQIHRSLELLERLSLIVYDRKKGRHVQTGGQVLPDREVERMVAVRFHQKMCDMAREAVTRVPAMRREMNTLTLCVSDEVAMKASEILYKACQQVMKLEAESKTKDQIYQVNVHLFPFTRTPGTGEEKS